MKILLMLGVVLFSLFVYGSEIIIEASDFGIIPNTQDDMSIKINKFVKSIDSSRSTTVLFRCGTYYFHSTTAVTKEMYLSNHDQTNPKKVAFCLENQKNLTLDAQKSKFIFSGRMIPFVLESCENVTLKNISIDYDQTAIGQIEILSVDTQKDKTLVKIIKGVNYKVNDNKLFFFGRDWEHSIAFGIPFEGKSRHCVQNAPDVAFNPKEIKDLGEGLLELTSWTRFAVGTRFAGRSWYRPTPGIVVSFSKNSTLENIKIHFAEGMGLLAQMSENITLNHFEVTLRDATDERYYTTQADATHFSGCKGKIISKNGFYEGMMDDAINVHGTYLKVEKRLDSYRVQARYMHGQSWGFLWGYVGDEVQFVESSKMEICGKNQIKSILTLDKPTAFGAKIYELTFENPIPNEIGTQNVGIENLTWTPEVDFSNNLICNNRARGALFSTPRKVIIKQNIFDHVTGCSILLCGDCNGWYETGACHDVLIEDNTFINALTTTYQFTNAVISIYPEIPHLDAQKTYFHSNVVIKNNLFSGFEPCLVYAKSIDGLLFEGNTIVKTTDYKPSHWNKYPFFFERVKNVVIKNNRYFETFPKDYNEIFRLNLTDKSEIQFDSTPKAMYKKKEEKLEF